VQKLLDWLGKALDAYLCLLRAAYLAAIDYVQSAVKSALAFAKGLVDAVAAFAVLIKDISKGPGAWLGKLGSAVVDGIKNCLWSAFKRQVKEWFNSKLEEVLGLGLMIIRILCQGGISFAEVGKMAWEGLKAAIPGILVQILIEKLVAMIVPAAGAIMTIIEGLKAAWGTVSRILRAFELFMKFLQAVKTGNAAGPFAEALAAAAIAVIDFVANWLIGRLTKPAGAISGRLKGMAEKFKRMFSGVARVAGRAVRAVGRAARAVGRGIRTAGRAIVSTARRVVRAAGRAVRAVGRGIVRGARAVGRVLGRSKAVQALGRGIRRFGRWAANTRVGRALHKLGRGVRARARRARDWLRRKRDEWRKKREQRKEKTAEERRARAMRELPPKISGQLSRGVSRLRQWASLQVWRVMYRLSRLAVVKTSPTAGRIEGAASPPFPLAEEFTPTQHLILEIVNLEGRLALKSMEARAGVSSLKEQFESGRGESPRQRIQVTDPLAAAAFLRENADSLTKGDKLHFKFPDGSVATLVAAPKARHGTPVSTGLLHVQGLPGRGGSYDDIASAVSGRVPRRLHGPLQLLDIVEMSRGDAAVSMIAARDKLVGAGKVSLSELYAQSPYISGESKPTVGAAYAPGQKGAVAGERGVAMALGKSPAEPLRPASPGGTYFQAAMQVRMAQRLVALEMEAEHLAFIAGGPFEEYVRTKFRERLRQVIEGRFPVLQGRRPPTAGRVA